MLAGKASVVCVHTRVYVDGGVGGRGWGAGFVNSLKVETLALISRNFTDK